MLCFLVTVIFILLTAGYGYAVIKLFPMLIANGITPNVGAFLIGFLVYFIFYIWFQDFWKSLMSYITHELTHFITCYLSLGAVTEFVVSRGKGGYVRCSVGNTLISISPYFLPIVSFIPLGLIYFVQPQFVRYLYGFLGFSSLFHWLTFATQFRPYQPDFQQVGFVRGSIFVLMGNIFFFGLILAMLYGGYHAVGDYLLSGLTSLWELIRMIPINWPENPISITG